MFLSDTSIKRPVLATVISLLIVVLGIAFMLQMAVRENPDIDPPVVSIDTVYTGAAPQVMDSEITEVIESAISGVEGIRNIQSESRDGRAETTIEFNTSQNVDLAANDVRDAVGRVLSQLPEEAEDPVVRKADANARPMMWITLTSDRLDPSELSDYAERTLTDRMSILDGVARIRIGGDRRYAMRIWLDRQAMAARDLTVSDVEQALRGGNLELPAGRLESEARELTVRTESRLRDPEEFASLVVKQEDGYQIRLGEVARIERGVESERSILRSNGEGAIGLGIVRQSKANTIEVSDRVRAEIDAIQGDLPEGVELTASYDESLFIREAIKEVVKTLLLAIGLVVVIIFLFLRTIRATFIPAVTIPVSLIGAFIIMAPLGFSINVLTLLAMILAVGLVVDDAIVVLENVQRRIEEGEPPLVAAFHGTRQVGFAVIATSLTLIAVFIPIAFLQGSVGRLFEEFGLTMAAAVAFSSLIALTLAPMLCSKWLKAPDRTRRPNWFMRSTEAGLDGLTRGYRWLLERVIVLPLAVLGVALLVALLSVPLFSLLPNELTPTEDRGVIIIPSTAPEGATPQETFRSVLQVEEAIRPVYERGDANRIFSIVGWGNVPNSGFTILGLAPWDERDMKQQEITQEIFPKILAIPGLRAFAVNPPGLGQSSFEQPIQIVVGGSDYETVGNWADQLVGRASENQRILNLDTDYKETRPQLSVSIDRKRAADLGIRVQDISTTLESMIASRTVGSYLDRGREYDVIVQLEDSARMTPSDLESIFVRADSGELVPLSSLVTLTERGAPPSLTRVDRLPSVTITASLASGYDLGEALAYFEGLADEELPESARLSYLGQSQEFQESSNEIYFTFLLALVIVFLVLAAQFESFIHPAIIMLVVPLAVTGALLALWLTGMSINIYSQIGAILLIGLMAKNGILIVEFANQLREEGRSVREAIVEGTVLRFRPILMTAISTVVGAVPLVLSSGAGAESRGAIGVVVIGGLVLATLLTLFVVPVLYDLLARFTASRNAVAKQLERESQSVVSTAREEGHPAE
ncbi:efflux RND transporter permease subunit [Fodinicurvata halophila]|uniref:Efflux RND transporter permease subunit n=1 Tax=Fodinicurvata halophila TaxID=1419723 RepID=A0ABV8UGX1_9PROT